MKRQLVLLLLFMLSLLSICAQENCTKPSEDELIDLNTIAIKKCEIEEKKTTKKEGRNILRTKKSIRKKVTKRINTKAKKINKNINTNNALETNIIPKARLHIENVLFEVVEKAPEFASCKNTIKKAKKKCFKSKIQEHFEANFNPENILEDEIKGKIIVKLNISISGKITDIEIISKKKSDRLKKEIHRVCGKIKNIEPGTINGLPIGVTYVFPLNLTL